jgi:peptidoglycan/xylan/chitin deacetylase (PgdA/CDA1 family)
MTQAIILTYHSVEAGPAPLCVHPELFREHMDAVQRSGLEVLTVAELADRLRRRALTARTVTITFDDGFRSVAANAAPILRERGLRATVFCVAGRLGGASDWPSARPDTHAADLADELELAGLVAQGVEIGAHGVQHEPLVGTDARVLRDEIAGSRTLLEERLAVNVTSFAYPYGAGPSPAAAQLVADTFDAACTTVLSTVGQQSDRLALPRIDVHYVRRPERFQRLLAGSLGPYLTLRRVGAEARRLGRRDYAVQAAPSATSS